MGHDLSRHQYGGSYEGSELDRVAFPLGGMGAGMVCLEGSGSLGSVSVRGKPHIFNQPQAFAAISVKGGAARVLEGPVAPWKYLFPWGPGFDGAGNGAGSRAFGLPRMEKAVFAARFPFATVDLSDPAIPLKVELRGWSPFIPNNADDSSLPVGALEYTFTNTSSRPIEVIYSFHTSNFMADPSMDKLPVEQRGKRSVGRTASGFTLNQAPAETQPWSAGSFLVATDAPGAKVDVRWFRGGWFDAFTLAWKSVTDLAMPDTQPYTEGNPSNGGSIYVPISLAPGASQTVRVRMSWYVPHTDERHGKGLDDVAWDAAKDTTTIRPKHRPWYAGKFDSAEAVDAYWAREYGRLRGESVKFSDCLFDSTLPAEVVEAVSANLTILKAPTVQRQMDGRLWVWEGCLDISGSCHGSCTHVWNYAQAIPHLFPAMERSLRGTEFHENQDARGHQNFRACLPIRQNENTWHAAADGQLGGIMKAHREWRISGDTAWLREIWPNVKKSIDYCIATWDPDHEGWVKEPHHNTYDIEFWGPDGMCGTIYAGALKAAGAMARAVGDSAALYEELVAKAKVKLETELYDGEYFIQKVRWKDLHHAAPGISAGDTVSWNVSYSPEAIQMLEAEGPKYQYGTGCLSDGILGEWMAEVCGVGGVLDKQKVRSHLLSIHKYNFRKDLSTYPNPQRPTFALGKEGGLLLCSWPKGGALSLPFVYSNEVWTGIEYQVASHLMMAGCVNEGLEIVRAARDRYDGRVRNPFSEIECGHWYARALASFALIQGLTGQRYDAATKTLYLKPQIRGDFRSFISTATGYGTVGIKGGKPFLEVKSGAIPYERIEVLG